MIDVPTTIDVKPKKKKIIKKVKESKYCSDNMGIDFNFDKVEAEVF